MPRTVAAAITAFRRRITAVALLAGAGRGVVLVGGLGAATLVALRLARVPCSPSWWWAFAALPVVALAVLRARRERMAPAAAAAHLDRRLGLDGLLLTAAAAPDLDPAWRTRVDAALVRLPAALPHPRWRRLVGAPLFAAALGTGAALLPPPALPPGPRQLPTYQVEIGRIAAGLQDLFERGHVPEEIQHELQRRFGELQQTVAEGKVPEWRDLDELDQRITREQQLQLAQEAKTPRGSPPGRAAASALPVEALARAAKMLAALGLTDRLPAQLAPMLQALQALQAANGAFDPQRLGLDPAQLQALAEQVAELAGKLPPLDQLGLDPGELAELEAVLRAFGGNGNGAGDAQRPGAGRGGIDRGPGHAALDFTEQVGERAEKAVPLLAARGLPSEWVPVGEKRIDPVVAPERPAAAGGEGVAGHGGATWQLDYAPRHREVLRRFFDADAAGGKPADGLSGRRDGK